jgi:hypothetical protein
MKYQIEKNIPIPKRVSGLGWAEEQLKAMGLGDSVLTKGEGHAQTLRIMAKHMGMLVIQRTLPEGVRVWRIK